MVITLSLTIVIIFSSNRPVFISFTILIVSLALWKATGHCWDIHAPFFTGCLTCVQTSTNEIRVYKSLQIALGNFWATPQDVSNFSTFERPKKFLFIVQRPDQTRKQVIASFNLCRLVPCLTINLQWLANDLSLFKFHRNSFLNLRTLAIRLGKKIQVSLSKLFVTSFHGKRSP